MSGVASLATQPQRPERLELTAAFGPQAYGSTLHGNDRFGPSPPFWAYFEDAVWGLFCEGQQPLAGYIVDNVAWGFPTEVLTSARNLVVTGRAVLRLDGEVIGYPNAPQWELEGFHGRLVGRDSEYSFDLLKEGRYVGHAQEAGVEQDEEGAWSMNANRLVLQGTGRLAELSGEAGMSVGYAMCGGIFFRTSSGLYHLAPGTCLGIGDTVPPNFAAMNTEWLSPPPAPGSPPPR